MRLHERRHAAIRNTALLALLLALAAFCATIVRNVTDTMTDIARPPTITADIDTPRR